MDDPVQAQLDAYNARNLEQFLACYAEDAVIENADGQRLLQGREAMRDAYGGLFANHPGLHADVPTRIRVGEFVIDEELVTGMSVPGLPPVLRSAVVYRVRDGLIVHVRLLS